MTDAPDQTDLTLPAFKTDEKTKECPHGDSKTIIDYPGVRSGSS
jgi:hypothetical protein